MRGRTARRLVWVIAVVITVVIVRSRGFGPMLISAATVATLTPLIKQLLEALDTKVPRDGVASWRTVSQVVAAVGATAVALAFVAPRVAPSAKDERVLPSPPPQVGVPTGTPTQPTGSTTPTLTGSGTASPTSVDPEAAQGLTRYCDLSREFSAESGELKGAFASGEIRASDVQPLIDNLKAGLAVAPREVERDFGALLSEYQAFQRGIGDTFWENALVAGGTILSSRSMASSGRIDEFDQEHCVA